MSNHFRPGPGDPNSGFNAGFLQTGSRDLDELLRTSDVGKGGAVNLEFAGGWPATFLLALCKAALLRGERAVFLYVPTFVHLHEDEENNIDVRSGRALESEFADALDSFGLAPFFNDEDFSDATAKLRYLVANTFQEFEDTLDSLLSDPAGPPDQVLVYGLEQLFQHVRIFQWMPEEDDALYLVQAESARLRRWLQEAAPRLEAKGTALWLSRSADSYGVRLGTLFLRGLHSLLQTHCPTTLLVETTETECGCGECPWDMPGIGGVPVTLYKRDELQGFTFATVLQGEDSNAGFDGPFADSEPGIADFLDALG